MTSLRRRGARHGDFPERWPALGGRRPEFIVDLDRFDSNATELVRRASGLPIRVATKSLRVRSLIDRVLARDGFAGLLCYSLDEALWLAEAGHTDLLVAYPSVDREALARLARHEWRSSQITLMVDSTAHLDLIESSIGRGLAPVRVAIDIDCAYEFRPLRSGASGRGGTMLGAHRSPCRTPEQATALAREIVSRPRLQLVGLMFYDAQIAGVVDTFATRFMKKRSWAELVERRASVHAAVSRVADLEIVNAGGSGSLHLFAGASAGITDVAAGSGLFQPTLFDGYDVPKGGTALRPAAFFGCPVVRRHSDDVVVVQSGGYLASGPGGADRAPTPVHPPGLRLFAQEGAGEVQTPVRGDAARHLELGQTVWFRHTKAGEATERFDEVHLVRDGAVVETVPTYRGERRNHG